MAVVEETKQTGWRTVGSPDVSRNLPYPVFDADNHLYERREAFTKHLPAELAQVLRFSEIDGRSRLVIGERICNVLPNPTLEKAAPPGALGTKGLPRVIDSPPEFFEPEPRLALMDEFGIDRALLWPTLGLSIEERFSDRIDIRHAVTHAYNVWLDEHWGLARQGRLYSAPIITLPIVDRAIAELEWVVARGARVIYVQPAPVPGLRGRRSMALPEFDPFWAAVENAGVLVGMHSGDAGLPQQYLNNWEGTDGETQWHMKRSTTAEAFLAFTGGLINRMTSDVVASLICHGLVYRFPNLRFLMTEVGTDWVRPTLATLGEVYATKPDLFESDPVAAFKSSVRVHCFHEPDPIDLIHLLGADTVVFGSDFPHPEGLADPLQFVDALKGLPESDVAKVMGGNLNRLLHLD